MAAQHILASNVCPKTLENDGIDYFKNHISLAKDVSVYLDVIKCSIIQNVRRININEVSNCEIPRPPIEVSEEESRPFDRVVFNETSQGGHSRIRKTMIGNKQCIKEDIPYIYQIKKHLPKA